MILLLIVIPCTLVGILGVTLLDRGGMLPRLDRPGPASTQPIQSMARPVSMVTIGILATWILAWLVVLFVGLDLVLSSR